MNRENDIRHEASSGSVFADVGLVSQIHRIVRERGLTQAAAAAALGIDQPRVSALLRGKLNLFSLERLMELLARLGNSVEIRLTPSAQPSMRIVLGEPVKVDSAPSLAHTSTTLARCDLRFSASTPFALVEPVRPGR
jgi:predicted XRE-type DNA-binding protein